MLKKIIPALLLAVAVNTLEAAPKCWEIKNSVERLSCFDHIAEQNKDSFSENFSIDWSRDEKQTGDTGFSLLNERWELEQDLIQYAFP